MSVMNINKAYIACLFSNNEDDFVWRTIERDLDEEESNILQLQHFWLEYVCNRKEPPLTEKPDMVLDVLRRYYGPADKSQPAIVLAANFLPVLEEVVKLKETKSALDAQVRQLDKQIKAAYAPIVNLMGQACTAECAGPNSAYHVSFSPRYRETLRKDGLSVLRAQYPDIYDDLVDTTESRIFSVSKVTL